MAGDERFSTRDDERSREEKLAAKNKAKAVGAKAAVGGDASWEALQSQLKKKQAEKAQPAKAKAAPAAADDDWEQLQAQLAEKKKKQQAPAPAQQKKELPRSTFATAGDERFSERSTGTDTRSQKGASAKPKPQPVDDEIDLDAELAAALNESDRKSASRGTVAAPAAAASKRSTRKEPVQQPPQQDFEDDFDAELAAAMEDTASTKTSTRSTAAKKSVRAAPAPAPADEDDLDAELARFQEEVNGSSGRATAAASRRDAASRVDSSSRATFAAKGDERFSERPDATRASAATAKRSTVRAPPEPAAGLDEDAELLALEADLGGHLRPSEAPAGRVAVVSTTLAPATKATQNKQQLPKEKAKGGPELPEGLSWYQTPVKTEMSRSTFAHNGEERFSNRRDPSLPTGTLTESPAQACAFCHQEIQAGQKFKTALDALWHNECFKCGVCLKKLEKGMKFFKGDMGSALCEDCKQKRRQVCALCQKPTAKTQIVNVMGTKIHLECFRCNICDTSLTAGYVQCKGQYLCLTHRDAEPVQRNWADPSDRGPGEAPKKQPVAYGPTEEDKKRAAAARKKKEQEEEARQRATTASYRAQGLDDSGVDLSMLSELLEDVGQPSAQSRQTQQPRDTVRRSAQVQSQRRTTAAASQRQSEVPEYDSRYYDVDSSFDTQMESGVEKTRASTQQRQTRRTQQYDPPAEDDYYDGPQERTSGERMMDEADKPDWMREREARERGSMRTNARKVQEDLDRYEGREPNAGYYSMSDEDEEEQGFQIKMQQQKQQPTKKK